MICKKSIADVVLGSDRDENPGFVEGHTFEGNPISCAAGIAVLREKSLNTTFSAATFAPAGRRVSASGLRATCGERFEVIGDIRGKGLFQAIEFVRDRGTRERFPADRALGMKVGRRALENGLLCRFDPHWIAFGPPLISTSEDVDAMVALLDKSLGEVLRAEGLA